ncbi:Surfeit locus protein 1 [Vitis vinifera]|nr:Surfeit locus protein 1 [Vitis vinifera]
MLDYRRKRLDLEPIPGSNLYSLNEKLDSLEFRRVKAKGFFDEKKSIYVGPRSRSISGVTENGYYLITPLMPIPDDPDRILDLYSVDLSSFAPNNVLKILLSVQSPILVNRGWVPRSWRDKFLQDLPVDEQSKNIASPSIQESERSSWWRFWSKKPKTVEDQVPAVTPVEVVGVVRGSEKPSIFVPENDLCSRQWFYVDVPAISRASGLAENTIYVDDINENVNPSNPYPVPKEVSTLIRSSVMPQDHLNYTLTCDQCITEEVVIISSSLSWNSQMC